VRTGLALKRIRHWIAANVTEKEGLFLSSAKSTQPEGRRKLPSATVPLTRFLRVPRRAPQSL
jgi:hypothetical protein